MIRATAFVLLLITAAPQGLPATQAQDVNYDESKVPEYVLPDPLITSDGTPVEDVETWRSKRRPEILKLFEKYVYGRSPGRPEGMSFKVFDHEEKALGGRATRKQVTIRFSEVADGPSMDLLIYMPNHIESPVPVFLVLNFWGNHSIVMDPAIRLSPSWMRDNKNHGIVDHRSTETSRGKSTPRWAVEEIIDRGYALATYYYGDIDPDYNDGFQNGVQPLFYGPGQTRPKDAEWGSIAAWAWGLSRAMDYLETDNRIDAAHVAVMGHSRLGKTGATDERFAITISNDSGCGGAALSRRRFGEKVKRINTAFPHWFCTNFKAFNDRENELPVDQHMLVALIAPRPVYVASAAEDRWADPKGEFLSALNADPVYRLLGTPGLGTERMPEIDQPVMGTIGYHIRSGAHDVTDYDWAAYLDFADKHFGK